MALANQKKTMGRLIGDLRLQTELPESAETIISDALGKRNFLIHHYFRERAEDFMSPAGCRKMIAELEEIKEELEGAFHMASMFALALGSFLGVRPEAIGAEVNKATLTRSSK
jgi:hypothetical protein